MNSIEFTAYIKNGFEENSLPLEFKDEYDYDTFRRCYHSVRALNATLETDYIAVYRKPTSMKNKKWKKGDIDLCCDEFYIVTRKGKVLHHTNSEWGGIGYAKS